METDRSHYTELIRELAGLCGIVPEYYDIFGNRHLTPDRTARAILMAMQLDVESEDGLRREIERRKVKPWDDFVPPVMVIPADQQPCSIPVSVPLGERPLSSVSLIWTVTGESDRKESFSLAGDSLDTAEERWIGGIRHVKLMLRDARKREIGYYTVGVSCTFDSGTGSAPSLSKNLRLIITPDACYLPERARSGQARGLSVNLYAVRSARNWGIGDFGDLREIIAAVGRLGGDFVGVNPLHALPNTMPYGISPYSPLSRIFRNFIYLDMEAVPDVRSSRKACDYMSSPQFTAELDALRKAAFVDYERVASLKRSVLMLSFRSFLEGDIHGETERGRSFRNFIENEGAGLAFYAVYSVLREQMINTRGVYSWQEWPREYHDPSGPAVQEFADRQGGMVLFHQYLQWLIDEQLKEVRDTADRNGLTVGLYNDLAVGSVAGGCDTWSFGSSLASNADVGAPPDDFSVSGQNWGFPPMIPENLQESGYELFIRTIRQNMMHAGALRIDHALGLFRMFWIPAGLTAKEGAYVTYPAEDLLRIIALESVRNRAVVVAEDLGTLEESFRQMLQRFGMLSYRLFYFERNYPDPSFRNPGDYPAGALCAVTTHDLPTLYGFWQGQDIETKKGLGMYQDDQQWKHDLEMRGRDRGLILSALRQQGLIGDAVPADGPMTPELCTAIYRYLSLSPCRMLLVSLDDVIGTIPQQNMPGTVDQHPNWIQKTPLPLQEILSDPRLISLMEALRRTD